VVKSLQVEFSASDILFLIETVDPQLVSRIDTIKDDPVLIEGMLDNEFGKLFQRIMLMREDRIMARITPRFLFEVLLRAAIKGLEGRRYTVERTARQKIPVFDSSEVVRFFGNRAVLRYLVDMLSSFTRTDSFTVSRRVRAGVWRKVRFSDMDVDSLVRLCDAVDEEYRFGIYKRIADLCLFILGMFPEYVISEFRYPLGGQAHPKVFGKWVRSAEDYETEGRRFYHLAGEHRNAVMLDLAEVLGQLHDNFNLARKPLNYISENLVLFKRQRLFPSISAE